MARPLIALVLVLLLAGCAAEVNRNVSADVDSLAVAKTEDQSLKESLFKDDQKVISNEDMEKILSAKVVLPQQGKLAVIRFGQLPYWWGWSEDFVRMNEKIDGEFLGKLRGTPRLRQVAYLPSLVTPSVMTIPLLRQSAARCQADLMLIYRTSSRNYPKSRFLAKDQTRAYCTVEAVIVDTRSGIIPFSTVVSEDYSTTESSRDMGFYETVARAQQEAIGKAWNKLADEVVVFLNDLAK